VVSDRKSSFGGKIMTMVREHLSSAVIGGCF